MANDTNLREIPLNDLIHELARREVAGWTDQHGEEDRGCHGHADEHHDQGHSFLVVQASRLQSVA